MMALIFLNGLLGVLFSSESAEPFTHLIIIYIHLEDSDLSSVKITVIER